MKKKMKFDHKEIFIHAAKAIIESYKRELEINNFLYNYGIDIANYSNPAYTFLESFVSDNYDDEHGIIMDCLFILAEFGSVNVDGYEVTTVEEIYDFFFKRRITWQT